MNKLWIICVDDQREVLNSIVRDLAVFADWVDIDECESAEEALELIDEQDQYGRMPALIISDHLMPNKNGVELLSQLQKDRRFPHLKKILLTGQATHRDTIEAINLANINYYIEKPWQPDFLQKVCRQLLSEYLFATGKYSKEYQSVVDSEVMMKYLRADH